LQLNNVCFLLAYCPTDLGSFKTLSIGKISSQDLNSLSLHVQCTHTEDIRLDPLRDSINT